MYIYFYDVFKQIVVHKEILDEVLEYVQRIGIINDPNMSDKDFKSGLEKFVADVIKSFRRSKDVDSYSSVTKKDIAIEYAKQYLAERAEMVGVG